MAASPPQTLVCADGLRLSSTISADTDVFARFFAGYDRAFVLPNEKEDEAGFKRCFALNCGAAYARLSALYGPYSEVCLIAEDGALEVGGGNFIAVPVDARTVTANLNYIYIDHAARGRGYLSRLLTGVRETIAALFPGRVLIFIEQNDPFRMSAEDYARDTEFTSLDQFDRLRIWARRGARVVDFEYAQPPLSAEQQADDTLVYSVLGAQGDTLEACTLEAHLTRFFGVSVLKGADIASNAAARAQLEALRDACARGTHVALRNPGVLLTAVRRREDALKRWPVQPESFRAALAEF